MVCEKKSEHVVLLHGIGRGSSVMKKLSSHLLLHGFCPHNIDYPSRTARVEILAQNIYQQIQPLLENSETKVHFVGHSLGGIIIRYILQHFEVPNRGRIVMLAPPNQGSEVAEFLKKYSFYRNAFGPAGQQLGTKDNQLLQSLNPPDYEVGIIAGDRSVDFLFSWFLLSSPNDGKVTVESTKLEGMTDHIVLHAPHPFVPNFKIVIHQARHFLTEGKFKK